MSAADFLMHERRDPTAFTPGTGTQNQQQMPAAPAAANPLRLAQELELMAAHLRSVADQAMFQAQSFRQHRRQSSWSGSSDSTSSGSCATFDDRVVSVSSRKSNGEQGSTIHRRQEFRAKGAMAPDGRFEFNAEMGSASSSVKMPKHITGGDEKRQAQSDGSADSLWSIPVSEIIYPDQLGANQPRGSSSSGKQEQSQPVIHFPGPNQPSHSPPLPSSDTSSASTPKPLRVTETHELSTWPATWTWVQANKYAAPLMLTLLLSTILVRWIAMRRAVAARRVRRGAVKQRVQQEKIVEVEQVVGRVVMDDMGNVVGMEETVSAEKKVMPTVTIDSATHNLTRRVQEHLDHKQREWKFEVVRIPFWYTLSIMATLAICLMLDFFVLRPFTLPVAPPAAVSVNHPIVGLGLAVLHTGVVAATMASLARTVGFVRKEWDQYQRGN